MGECHLFQSPRSHLGLQDPSGKIVPARCEHKTLETVGFISRFHKFMFYLNVDQHLDTITE